MTGNPNLYAYYPEEIIIRDAGVNFLIYAKEKNLRAPEESDLERQLSDNLLGLVRAGKVTPYLELDGEQMMVPNFIAADELYMSARSVSGMVEVPVEFYLEVVENGEAELKSLPMPEPHHETEHLELIKVASVYLDGSTRYFPVVDRSAFEFRGHTLISLLESLGVRNVSLKLPEGVTRSDPLRTKLLEYYEYCEEKNASFNASEAWNYVLKDPEFDEKEGKILFNLYGGEPRKVSRTAFTARLRRIKQPQ